MPYGFNNDRSKADLSDVVRTNDITDVVRTADLRITDTILDASKITYNGSDYNEVDIPYGDRYIIKLDVTSVGSRPTKNSIVMITGISLMQGLFVNQWELTYVNDMLYPVLYIENRSKNQSQIHVTNGNCGSMRLRWINLD